MTNLITNVITNLAAAEPVASAGTNVNALLLFVIVIAIYVTFYFTYGRFLANKIIKVDDSNPTPAQTINDGVDYVPTNKFVLFGHHFASIAGAAPIIGPIIALVWGWGPALLWILLGNIFIGSIHDYLSLMISVRFGGKSIQYLAGKLIKPRTGKIFAWFILFVLLLVVAAFSVVVAKTFQAKPAVALASLLFIGDALLMGVFMNKWKLNRALSTVLGVILMIGSIWLSIFLGSLPWAAALVANPWYAANGYYVWLIFLFFYIIIAASLSVKTLLQPRDYLNSFLLYIGLFLGALAIIVLHKGMNLPAFTAFSAPALSYNATTVIDGIKESVKVMVDTPFWPAIPLIIACGSLSGFHSLVSSGTTAKQLEKESDGLMIGFGGMLTEGVLSTIVILLVGAFYMNLTDMSAAGQATSVFATAFGGSVQSALSLSDAAGQVIVVLAGLWIASFAMTTLDTTNRIARYIVSELAEPMAETKPKTAKFISNPWISAVIPAFLGILLAWSGSYTIVWPAFGGANQMLASIALITIAAWVMKKFKGKGLFALIPAIFLWATVTGALTWFLFKITWPQIMGLTFDGIILGIMVLVMLTLNVILMIDFIDVLKSGKMKESLENI